MLRLYDQNIADMNTFQEKFKDCIKACYDCAYTCDHCAVSCLKEAEVRHLAACIQLDLFCAGACRTAASFMARVNDPGYEGYALQMCRLCAQICEDCATECEQHHMDHCRDCAEACRKCAEECRKMAA